MPERAAHSMLLASQSPRRRRLLRWLGVPFRTTHVDTPEELDTPLAADPAALACALAEEKADAARDQSEGEPVLCFDTIVVHEGRVLGKPADPEDAKRMLRSLAGRTHEVVTGCAVLCQGEDRPVTFAVVTPVRMKDLDEAAIEAWMSSGEYLGCAGAYNIEGQVAEVTEDECFQNVAGLPLCHLYAVLSDRELVACEIAGLAAPVSPCDAALRRTCRLGPKLVRREAG